MKICVTGGAGMIGSNLVRQLNHANHEILVIDNLWRGKLDNLKENDHYIIDILEIFFNYYYYFINIF